jgi:hypothetical protein
MKRIYKYLLISLTGGIGLILLVVLTKTFFAFLIYSFFLGKISSAFGLDPQLSRAIAILAMIGSLVLLPWIISFFIFGTGKKDLLIVASIAIAACYLALYYGTANVFFDRTTGQPAKYYIKTLDGFKFSSKEDFDPEFGIRYKPITQEIVKEYFFWQKTGNLKTIPEVKAGKYFDMITGEPIVWYSERQDGTIKLFSLPGHDPTTGELLKPITKDVAKRKQINFGKEEPTYERKKIVRLIKDGKIDLDWYFKTQENAFDVESDIAQLGGNSGLFGIGPWEHEFDLFVEKIIFLPPSFTVIGVCFKGVENVEKLDVSAGSILDARNIKHRPLNYIGVKKWRLRSEIDLNKGEVKRVFYVLEYIPPEELKTGAHTGIGDSVVRFSLK